MTTATCLAVRFAGWRATGLAQREAAHQSAEQAMRVREAGLVDREARTEQRQTVHRQQEQSHSS